MLSTYHRLRRLGTAVLAFIRLDFVEEISYPMSASFRYTANLLPVFLYFFQARFLNAPESFTATLIGISVAVALQQTLSGFGSRLQMAQDRGTFETFLVEPISWRFVPLAMNVWRTLIGVISTVLMLLVGVALGADLRIAGLPALAGLLVLGVLAANAIGLLAASLLVLSKRSDAVLALYGLAASLLGGALFSIDVLPAWLRVFSYAVPHAYVISAARDVLMVEPVAGGMPLTTALVGLLAFNVVVFALGFLLFGRSLQYARRMGLLGGY